jgi:hypothetical protein
MKNCFKAFNVSFNVDSDTLKVSDVRHAEGLAAKWQGDVMLAAFPYASWGCMKDSEVVIKDFHEEFERICAITKKIGEETASFLTDCGDYEGGVMLLEEPTYYVNEGVYGGYTVVVDYLFICENEDESTDEQCYSVVYMTKEVFDSVLAGNSNVVMN